MNMCDKSKKRIPPQLARWLIRHMADYQNDYSISGDVDEVFCQISEERNYMTAWLWYWYQCLIGIYRYFSRKIYWSVVMFKNYIKTAWRNVTRHKGYSLINISGLSLGMACCILIMLWVQDELSYDKFNNNFDRIYRINCSDVWEGIRTKFNVTPSAFAGALQRTFPEVEVTARYETRANVLLQYEEKSVVEASITFTDPGLFNIFSFPFVKGDPETAFADPNSVILSESCAKKYFGGEDPLGKAIKYNDEFLLTVRGVFKDIPKNSHMRFEIAVPVEKLEDMQINTDAWGDYSFLTYFLLKEEASLMPEEALTEMHLSHTTWVPNINIHAQPLADIHLRSHYLGELPGGGDIQYIYVFSMIAVFVLLIACINFMNLSTARSANRAKEIGLRKVVGACRTNIISQFYNETILLSLLSLPLAILFVKLALPVFNELSAKELSFGFSANMSMYIGLFVILLITGLVSGSYPSLFLSSFRPVNVLKGKLATGARGSARFRQVLVVLQFSLSLVFMIGALVVSDQLNFMKNRKLGFDQEQIIVWKTEDSIRSNYKTIKSNLLLNPQVVSVTTSEERPFFGYSSTLYSGEDGTKNVRFFRNIVDYDYCETFNPILKDGRFFSKEFVSDSAAVILNETAVLQMGLEDPLDRTVEIWGRPYKVIGIVKDFHFESLISKIAAHGFFLADQGLRYMFIKVRSENIAGTIEFLEETWREFELNYPFKYSFMDEDFDTVYRTEQRISTVFGTSPFLRFLFHVSGFSDWRPLLRNSAPKRSASGKLSGQPLVVLFYSFRKNSSGVLK